MIIFMFLSKNISRKQKTGRSKKKSGWQSKLGRVWTEKHKKSKKVQNTGRAQKTEIHRTDWHSKALWAEIIFAILIDFGKEPHTQSYFVLWRSPNLQSGWSVGKYWMLWNNIMQILARHCEVSHTKEFRSRQVIGNTLKLSHTHTGRRRTDLRYTANSFVSFLPCLYFHQQFPHFYYSWFRTLHM